MISVLMTQGAPGPARGSTTALFRQMVRYGRGRVRLLRKHPETFSIKGFIPALFVVGLIAGAVFSPGALTAVDTEGRVALTSLGGAFPYDVLLVACGAIPTPAVSGAITFRGPADT